MRRNTAVLAFLLLFQAVRAIEYNDTIEGYCGAYGIEVERHSVLTSDDYVLTTFRLARRGSPVVVLQHGAMGSSWIFLSNHPRLSVALELYNTGYDVWLPNSRGNMFSLGHRRLNRTRDREYWNFTFMDFARYDLPANVDHILASTGRRTLSLIAHSEGAAAFFLANALERPAGQLEGKINLFIGVSPIAYMANLQSPILNTIADFQIVDRVSEAFPLGVPPFAQFADFLVSVCAFAGMQNCKYTIGMLFGQSSRDSLASLSNHTAHFPAGTSMKNVKYYTQLHASGALQDFDYGPRGNRWHYGQDDPPKIRIGGHTVPTALFVGGNDSFASRTDSRRLAAEISTDSLIFKRTFEGFSHMTWVAGDAEAFREWFPHVRDCLRQYNPLTHYVEGEPADRPQSFLARTRFPDSTA